MASGHTVVFNATDAMHSNKPTCFAMVQVPSGGEGGGEYVDRSLLHGIQVAPKPFRFYVFTFSGLYSGCSV